MRRAESGFTLLEVLVASVLMAIAVAGVLSALSTTTRNAARLTDYDRAAVLARRKMEELMVERKLPRNLPLSGQYDRTLTGGRNMGWRARVMVWEMPPGAGPGTPILDRLELEVWWDDGDRRRTFTLDGFRRGLLTAADVAAAAPVQVLQ